MARSLKSTQCKVQQYADIKHMCKTGKFGRRSITSLERLGEFYPAAYAAGSARAYHLQPGIPSSSPLGHPAAMSDVLKLWPCRKFAITMAAGAGTPHLRPRALRAQPNAGGHEQRPGSHEASAFFLVFCAEAGGPVPGELFGSRRS